MTEYLKDNAVWLTPVLVAIVSGVFYLLKKSGANHRQIIKDVKDSHVNQAVGDISIKEEKDA